MPSAGVLEAGRAVIKFVLNDKDVAKGLQAIQRKAAQVGQSLMRIGSLGAAAAASIGAPLIIAVKAASDARETMSKFSVVFAEQTEAMKSWSDNFAKSVGRSKYEVAGFLASFQDLLVPMGMAAGPAAEMSKQLSALAVDLGSFNNMADADVVRDLQAALTGSGEVMKKYGVIVSEAAVKQELLNMGLDPKAVSEAEKAQARLNIIMAGTTAAQGDALRTADGFANVMKALKSQISDVAADVGEKLLPFATDLVNRFSSIVNKVADWVSKNPELVGTIAKVTFAIGAMSAAVFGVGTAITIVTAHPILAGVTLLAAAILAISEAFKDTESSAKAAENAILQFAKNSPDFSEFVGMGRGLEDWAKRKKAEHDAAKPATGDRLLEAAAGGLAGALQSGIGAARLAASQAALGIGAGRESLSRMSAEQTVAGLQAGQGLDDDLRRAQIDAIEDEKEQRKAAIEFETELMARSLKEQGLLTPGNQAKLDALEAARLDAIGAAEDTVAGVSSSPAVTAVLDASFAGLQFGKGEDKQVKLLEEIRDDARDRDRRPNVGKFG